MKLVLTRSGGVAGLRKAPLEIETADLPAAARDRLRALVDAAHLATPPPEPAPGSADQLGYSLTVTDDDGTARTVELGLPAASPELGALIAEIRRLATVK
jgi:hypothetical protein